MAKILVSDELTIKRNGSIISEIGNELSIFKFLDTEGVIYEARIVTAYGDTNIVKIVRDKFGNPEKIVSYNPVTKEKYEEYHHFVKDGLITKSRNSLGQKVLREDLGNGTIKITTINGEDDVTSAIVDKTEWKYHGYWLVLSLELV